MWVEICEVGDKEANKLIAMNEAQGLDVFSKKIRNSKTGFTRECYCVNILNHGGYHSNVEYAKLESGTYDLLKK